MKEAAVSAKKEAGGQQLYALNFEEAGVCLAFTSARGRRQFHVRSGQCETREQVSEVQR